MSSNTLDILIEKYLNGELAGVELEQFETKLKKDEALAKRLKFHQSLESTLSDQKAIDIQSQLGQLGSEFFKPEKVKEQTTKDRTGKVVSLFRRRLAVAAGILVLLTGSYFVYQNVFGAAPSNSALFAQYFEIYSLDQVRYDDGVQTDFESATALYLAGEYKQASSEFQMLLSQEPESETIQFSLAQSLLNEVPPNFTEASTLLESLVNNGSGALVPASKWYLALVYVQQDQVEKASPLLEEVIASGGSRGRAAKELLEKISSAG